MTTSQLTAQNRATFARHETFHPRYGWLRKAVIGAATDGELFTREDATVTLGVGKNMVNAIRYWGQAFKLLEQAHNPSRPRLPLIVPSELGKAMFSEEGWDPYLEAPGTLWVLHWWLLRPRTLAPVWWLAFNTFNAVQFTDAELARYTLTSIELAGSWADVLESSVKKDADCLLRMYSPRKMGQATDDLIDCPFRELELIQPVPREARTYRFVIGPKPNLPDAILAYAALDFMARTDASSTITIARLSQDVGSPGRAFKLTEAAIFESIARFAATRDALRLAEPAGVKQLLVAGDARQLADRVLEEYYGAETGSKYRFPTPAPTLLDSPSPSVDLKALKKATTKFVEMAKADPKLQGQAARLNKLVRSQVQI